MTFLCWCRRFLRRCFVTSFSFNGDLSPPFDRPTGPHRSIDCVKYGAVYIKLDAKLREKLGQYRGINYRGVATISFTYFQAVINQRTHW
jgi:hypothetical protein